MTRHGFIGTERQRLPTVLASLPSTLKRAQSAVGQLARGKSPRDYLEGLPERLSLQALELVVRRHFGTVALARIRHEHLSSWKRTGAFRVCLEAENGSTWSLVFKDACYRREEIPALDGMPQTPGPPEYLVHMARTEGLLRYLPQVYECHEISAGSHYVYLTEDLSRRHVRLPQRQLAMVVSQELPAIHAALGTLMDGRAGSGFLRFDQEFSQALFAYADAALHDLASTHPLPQLGSVLSAWRRLERFYRRGLISTYERVELSPVHGDLNPTNIWADPKDPRQLRLVDWEWAGLGIPHSDLVSVCKAGSRQIEREAVRRYNLVTRARPLDEDRTIFSWCKLQRCLQDAAIFSRQLLEGPSVQPSFDLAKKVERSLRKLESILDEANA